MNTQITELQKDLKKAKAKQQELQEWLSNHTGHPDFCKIAADRNHWSVKEKTIQVQIDNIYEHRPVLGDSLEHPTPKPEKNQ